MFNFQRKKTILLPSLVFDSFSSSVAALVGGLPLATGSERNNRSWRRWPFMPRAATLVIDETSGDSTGFVGLFTSRRLLAVGVFKKKFLLIGVLFIFLSLLFQIYHS